MPDFVPVDLDRLLELLEGGLLSALVLRGQVIVHCPIIILSDQQCTYILFAMVDI